MIKIFCTKYNKYRKFKNSKISYIFNEMLVLSIIFGKCGRNNHTMFKENNLLKY